MLDQIRFVLSHTTHPGNVGAAARALKTMGLSRLSLVEPKNYPSAEATQRASGAQDVLANAQVYTSVEAAIDDCKLVVGTSARSRTLPWPMLSPRQLAEKIAAEPDSRPVAILFGTENSGLTNEELQLCHYHVFIPTNPEYSSLNVASAVQLIAYEMRLAAIDEDNQLLDNTPSSRLRQEREQLASAGQTDHMFQHLGQIMESSGFYDPTKPKLINMRLRRLFNKAQLTDSEVRLMRGFLASIAKFKRDDDTPDDSVTLEQVIADSVSSNEAS